MSASAGWLATSLVFWLRMVRTRQVKASCPVRFLPVQFAQTVDDPFGSRVGGCWIELGGYAAAGFAAADVDRRLSIVAHA